MNKKQLLCVKIMAGLILQNMEGITGNDSIVVKKNDKIFVNNFVDFPKKIGEFRLRQKSQFIGSGTAGMILHTDELGKIFVGFNLDGSWVFGWFTEENIGEHTAYQKKG